MRFIASLLLVGVLAVCAFAQRPRTIDTSDDTRSSSPTAAPAPLTQTVKAKYEGGVFGYNNTMTGTLSFDDANSRLLFRDKEQKDVLFIPYDAVTSAFADTQKKRPAAATVASHIPYIGLPIGFIKKKVRYLTLQYNDPVSRVNGTTSFKLENKVILESFVRALADKADLTPHGQIYIKKRDSVTNKTGP